MEIVVIGNESNLKECQEKFGEGHKYQFSTNHQNAKQYFNEGAVVFDFEPDDISIYQEQRPMVFLNSVYTTLGQLTSGMQVHASFFGFAGMNSFLNRELLEVVVLDGSKTTLDKVLTQLNTKYRIVDDRVGLITPRIICMIINEAYFAIEEEVASREDIDLAMKLGTNYPFGPFEWCEKIGVKNVYQLLTRVYENSKDDRYKVCELLRREALG